MQATPLDYAASTTPAPSKVAFYVGSVLTILIFLMMGVMGVVSLLLPAMRDASRKGMADMGFPAGSVVMITAAEIACAVLYLVPRTSVFGAILLTGYLGGAVATHVRAGDGMWPIPIVFGVIAWLGLFLRYPSLRRMIPVRRG